MDVTTLVVVGTLLALALAVPGSLLSMLQLKDRWNSAHKEHDDQR